LNALALITLYLQLIPYSIINPQIVL